MIYGMRPETLAALGEANRLRIIELFSRGTSAADRHPQPAQAQTGGERVNGRRGDDGKGYPPFPSRPKAKAVRKGHSQALRNARPTRRG